MKSNEAGEDTCPHLEMFKIYRARIQEEYTLIGSRISWPLLIAGAIVIAMTSASGVNRGETVNYLPLAVGCLFLTFFFVCVSVSVTAAKTEIRRLRDDYHTESKKRPVAPGYEFLHGLIVARDNEHKYGDMLTNFVIYVMPTLCFICTVVFATRHAW